MLVGVAAAYIGGVTDGVLSTVTDILLVIPIFPLFIVIAAYLRSAGLLDIIIILGALNWSYSARQLRVQALSMRNRDFLKAAGVRGERASYIIVAEMLPSMSSLIVAAFCLNAVFAVLTAAGLQFIGLGDPNAQSWGTMLYWAYQQAALQSGLALWAIMPGVCIALFGGSLALINFAFDEISNPALRPVRRMSRPTHVPAPTSAPPRIAMRPPPTAGDPPPLAHQPASGSSPEPDVAGGPAVWTTRRRAGCWRSATSRSPTPPTTGRSWPSMMSTSTSTAESSSPSSVSPVAASRRSCSPSAACSPRLPESSAGASPSAVRRWPR